MPRAAVMAGLLCAGMALTACGGQPGASSGGSGGSPSAPAIGIIAPDSAIAGQPGITLTVLGTGAIAGSPAVFWNGVPLATAVSVANVLGFSLQATVPAALLTTAGYSLITVGPAVGGGTPSAPVSFGIAPQAQAAAGVVAMISVSPQGAPADGDTASPAAISSTGRYVVFPSIADNLVSGPASGFSDIYLRDTCLGAPAGCTPTTIRASEANDGTLPNGNSRSPTVSDDGRFVAYDSSATNLVPNDHETDNAPDIFLRDTCIGAPVGCSPTTTRISLSYTGGEPDTGSPATGSSGAVVSSDGRFVLFVSGADNLIAGQPQVHIGNVFRWDTCYGAPAGCTPAMTNQTPMPTGAAQDGPSGTQRFGDGGRYIAFETFATPLTPGFTAQTGVAMLRDTCYGAPAGCMPSYIPVSVGNDGSWPNGRLSADFQGSVSADGRYAPFSSFASNLTPGPMITNGTEVFLRDTCLGAPASCTPSTIKLTHGFDGSPSNSGSGGEVISANGRFVAFDSLATNLVPGDADVAAAGTRDDIFVTDTCNGAPAGCQPATVRVDLAGPGGVPGDLFCRYVSITADGKYVVFLSTSDNLVPGLAEPTIHNLVFLARTGF